MNKSLRYILIGLKSRVRSLQYGIVYLQSKRFKLPKKFFIKKKFIHLKFNQNSNNLFLSEFFGICIQDCYKTRSFPKNSIETILDIGANQGLFVLIARKVFPNATIHAYEPNYNLREYISYNCKQLNTKYFEEAVMPQDCKIKLTLSNSDLATQAISSEEGDIYGLSYNKVIEKLGGKVDLVKMDCEGGEWELLKVKNVWKNVKFLSMEYHLWHGAGHSLEELKQLIENLYFSIIQLKPINNNCGLLIAQNNTLS